MSDTTVFDRLVSALGRGKGVLVIALGFVLLLNPHVVGAYDIGDPDHYHYESSQVTFYPNGTVDGPDGVQDLDSQVACLEELPTRSCAIEIAVYENGGATFDGPRDMFLQSSYSYVYLHGEGFFEPAAVPSGDTTHYDLERASRTEALAAVSTQIQRASDGTKTAIREGSVDTSDPIEDAHELIKSGGQYYVVYPTSSEVVSASAAVGAGERGAGVVVMQWILGIVGAGLILYGQRLRVRRGP